MHEMPPEMSWNVTIIQVHSHDPTELLCILVHGCTQLLDWTGLDWTGLDWTGLDRTGLD